MKLKYIFISALLCSAIYMSGAVAQTTPSPETNFQSPSSHLLLEFLKIGLTPILIFSAIILFREQIKDFLNGGKAEVNLKDLSFKLERNIEKVEDVTSQQKEIEGTVASQQEKINSQQETINKLVLYSMSSYIWEHLVSIYYRKQYNEEYKYNHYSNMRTEMCYLRDNGFIKRIDDDFLEFDESLNQKDLIPIVELTDTGNWYVDLRINQQNH